MNAHGIEIAALVKGDVILCDGGRGFRDERIVMRVVDVDGARGGIVDTKPIVGGYSRSSGFRFGDEIVERLGHKFSPTRSGKCDVCGRSRSVPSHR